MKTRFKPAALAALALPLVLAFSACNATDSAPASKAASAASGKTSQAASAVSKAPVSAVQPAAPVNAADAARAISLADKAEEYITKPLYGPLFNLMRTSEAINFVSVRYLESLVKNTWTAAGERTKKGEYKTSYVEEQGETKPFVVVERVDTHKNGEVYYGVVVDGDGKMVSLKIDATKAGGEVHQSAYLKAIPPLPAGTTEAAVERTAKAILDTLKNGTQEQFVKFMDKEGAENVPADFVSRYQEALKTVGAFKQYREPFISGWTSKDNAPYTLYAVKADYEKAYLLYLMQFDKEGKLDAFYYKS